MTDDNLRLLAAFNALDLIAVVGCVVAAWCAATCARQPMYHSSANQRRRDRHLWWGIFLALIFTSIYKMVGGDLMLWLFGTRYLDSLSGQSEFLQRAVFASWFALSALMVLMVFGAMGESIKRNWLAVAGTLIVLGSLAIGIQDFHMSAQDASALLSLRMDYGLSSLGVIAGAIVATASAWVYRHRRRSQGQWRAQLRQSA